MDELGISLLDARRFGILRYEALQEVERSIRIDTPAVKVEVRSLDFSDPTIKALVERIKFAKLSWEKKEELLRLVFTYVRSAGLGSNPAQSQADFMKDIYALIQTMELTQKYRLGPDEMAQHKKNADQMCADFLIEEERARQQKEGKERAGYASSWQLLPAVFVSSPSRNEYPSV